MSPNPLLHLSRGPRKAPQEKQGYLSLCAGTPRGVLGHPLFSRASLVPGEWDRLGNEFLKGPVQTLYCAVGILI